MPFSHSSISVYIKDRSILHYLIQIWRKELLKEKPELTYPSYIYVLYDNFVAKQPDIFMPYSIMQLSSLIKPIEYSSKILIN